MRHKKSGRQFSRDTSSRRAMLRALAANLITHERIHTTDAKAKELRRVADGLIARALKLGTTAHTANGELAADARAERLHVARYLSAYLPRWGVKADGTKIDLVEKVLVDLSKRFAGRAGGYTRTVKIGPRRGDNAPISMIEFVDAAAPEDKVRQKAEAPVEESAEEPAAAAG